MKRILLLFLFAVTGFAADKPLSLTLQSRTPSGAKQAVPEQWLPQQSAIIVCDMWDLHHCKNAVTREGEMAPRMNAVLEKARGEGVLIIHAPSSCMKAYEGTPARERAKSAPQAARLPDKIAEWCRQIPAEELTVYPIDQTNGGEDDNPTEHAAWAKELEAKGLNPRAPWTKQIDVLRIDQDADAISDSGVEIWNLLEARGIRNVILMGVHVNMCVAGRPFGLRQMAKNGRHVVLMRDMTDAMYDPQRWPFVSHQRGTELFIEHIENRICPTITSDQFIGGQPFAFSKATAGKKRLQILLLGDSSTEASIPKKFAPREPQFEDVIRILLATEKDLPSADVINEGVSGETIRRLIDSGRYDRATAKLHGLDYIFIRYGLNDHSKREDFENNFPKDFHELLARLRKDHPGAMLIPMTVMPWANEAMCMKINNLVRQVAAEEKLTLFDIYPRYDAELKRGPDMLNYRRFPLAKIPENLRAFAWPYVTPGKDPVVVVLDNHLDGIFGHLPGWFGDRHPNLAGYNVIADETVKFLAPIISKKVHASINHETRTSMNRRTFIHQTAAATMATGLLDSVNAAESKSPLIIDTHQHLWDLTKQKLPWLSGVPPVLNQSYRTKEYRAATEGLNIRAVYMEVDVASEQHVAEAELVLDLARSGKNPTIAAVIGGRVASPAFADYIKKFTGNPLIKGVRQVLHVPGTPSGYCLREDFVRGVRLLGEQGMSFDLCMRPTDLTDGAKLVAQCPGTRFVLDHCGNPDLKCFRAPRVGEEKPKHTADEWKRAIETLAKQANVIGKISGVAANLPKGGDASDLAPAVNHCLDAFGPDRVVFGGDWPVCLLGVPLKRWLEFLTQIIASRPAAEQEKLWSANAIKHYALKV